MSSKEKLQTLIAGILRNSSPMPKVKLAKIILFVELGYFDRYGDSYTGLYFVRQRMGPVIAFFDEILEQGEETSWRKTLQSIPLFNKGRVGLQHSYALLEESLIPSALQTVIDNVLASYGHRSGTELSALSHALPAWKYSEPNEPIYMAELAAKTEDQYFALIDLMEDLDESEDESLPENIRKILS